MTPYDISSFDPPAPVAYVTLQHPTGDAKWLDVPMQIDTGADVTLIPEQAVSRLGLTVLTDTSYELEGYGGTITQASAVELKLLFCRRSFRGKFLLIDQPIGLLGRDILNYVALLFDGPNLHWSEHRSA